jgi:hypothetical protein
MAMEMIMHTYDDVARELVDRLVTPARPNVVASQKGGGEWNSSVAIDHHAELIGACRRTMMHHACTYILMCHASMYILKSERRRHTMQQLTEKGQEDRMHETNTDGMRVHVYITCAAVYMQL